MSKRIQIIVFGIGAVILVLALIVLAGRANADWSVITKIWAAAGSVDTLLS